MYLYRFDRDLSMRALPLKGKQQILVVVEAHRLLERRKERRRIQGWLAALIPTTTVVWSGAFLALSTHMANPVLLGLYALAMLALGIVAVQQLHSMGEAGSFGDGDNGDSPFRLALGASVLLGVVLVLFAPFVFVLLAGLARWAEREDRSTHFSVAKESLAPEQVQLDPRFATVVASVNLLHQCQLARSSELVSNARSLAWLALEQLADSFVVCPIGEAVGDDDLARWNELRRQLDEHYRNVETLLNTQG